MLRQSAQGCKYVPFKVGSVFGFAPEQSGICFAGGLLFQICNHHIDIIEQLFVCVNTFGVSFVLFFYTLAVTVTI